MVEQEGHDHKFGLPIAFFKVACQHPTLRFDHKAEEIQRTISLLAERYPWNNSFFGVVVAEERSSSLLDQMRSLGFHVLYFPYETLVAAFASVGIDIRFDEDTPDEEFRRVANLIVTAPLETLQRIKASLIELLGTPPPHYVGRRTLCQRYLEPDAAGIAAGG